MSSTKTLADFLKESAWSNNVSSNNSSPSTSMPWATAVKTHPDQYSQHQQQHQLKQQHHQHNHHHNQQQQHGSSSFDYGGTIGSWSSPETSSSTRGGWNADGSSKNESAFDDGTAIWGNPAMNKTGVDWIEKESLLNPPKVAQSSTNSSSNTNNNNNNNSSSSVNGNSTNSIEKRIQKPDPAASSINGTEAWGGPTRVPSNSQTAAAISTKNEISGNDVFATKPTRDQSSFSWGSEPFSLHETTNDNSSPPSNLVWNNMGFGNSSDWLSSSSSTASNRVNTGLGSVGSRIDELNKQLESTSLFDLMPTMVNKNPGSGNLNMNQHPIGIGLLGGGNGGGLLNTGNGCSGDVRPVGAHTMNDLKQMSANYSSNLLDLQNRPTGGLQASNNQQSQQLDSSAFTTAANPSRELLKQMVHQIQLAVHAGHLNAHILNQPMSTPTLQLVYQLLQQIKTLHQLQEIQQRAGITSDLSSPSNIDIQINRIRQSISILQKAITQQQAALTKNEIIGDSTSSNSIKQQQANSYSYATISKLSTNSKVPPNDNMSNIIGNNSIDSFRRNSLIDTLGNSNSDSLRSAQTSFDTNANIDKTLSSLIQASSANQNILGSDEAISPSGDYLSKAQANFGTSSWIGSTIGSKSHLLSAQPSTSSSGSSAPGSTPSSAWSAFGSDFISNQAWPNSQLRISSNASQHNEPQQHQFSAFDHIVSSDYGLQFNVDNSKQQHPNHNQTAQQQMSSGAVGSRPAPPPGLLNEYSPFVGGRGSDAFSINGERRF